MTREEALQILDTIPTIGEQVDALEMAIQALSQEPTVQDKQAESEKYQKAFDDGYANGYEQARFDYKQEPCDDAVSRKPNCIDCIHKSVCFRLDMRVDSDYAEKCGDFLTELPSVTRQTGEWIEEKINDYSYKVYCSSCRKHAIMEYVSTGDIYSASGHGEIKKTKFCPNCGAKMVEPQESEEI